MNHSKKAGLATGMVRVDLEELRRLTLVRGWNQGDLIEESGLGKATIQRIVQTGQARMSSLREIADAFGVRPADLIDPVEFGTSESDGNASTNFESTGEWLIGEPLTDVRTASNGLQHRAFRMKHRHQSGRFGRGKRYELTRMPDEAADRLRAKLVRHATVCDRAGRSRCFPTCYATYPESGRWVWWVIDEWVDGVTLEECLSETRPPLSQAAQWAWQLGEALAQLHEVGVIRRELSPSNILVRSDQSLMLTDFELAKLVESGPTVSEDWPEDPYRAPEVGAGAPSPAADWYSWGRVVAHAVSGELPALGAEPNAVAKRAPKAVTELISRCVCQRPKQRPEKWSEVREAVASWRRDC